jgi:hypothetical protein
MPWMDLPILCKEFQHAGCGGHNSISVTMAVHGRRKSLLHQQVVAYPAVMNIVFFMDSSVVPISCGNSSDCSEIDALLM